MTVPKFSHLLEQEEIVHIPLCLPGTIGQIHPESIISEEGITPSKNESGGFEKEAVKIQPY